MNVRYVPVEVLKENKRDIWYIDINNMTYSQLLKLKKELLGTISIRTIDKAISDNFLRETQQYYSNKGKKKDSKVKQKLMKKEHVILGKEEDKNDKY